jgi:methylmalonyl-CoA epimerase
MLKIKGLEHISWAAETETKGENTLLTLGFAPTGTEEIHSQDVRTTYYEHPQGVRFEIIRPAHEESYLHKFLEKRGPGLHHVCLQVENLAETIAELQQIGWEIVGERFSDSRGHHAFIHPRSTGGVLIGLIELHPGLV